MLNWLIIIRCVLSFIPHNPYNTILRFIYDMTDPILDLCGRFLPDALRAPLDFTPMVALLVIQLLYQVLVSILHVLF